MRVLAPYFAVRFLLLPGAFGVLLGSAAFRNSLVTLLLAEVLTNLHAFLNIVTNHAGDDLYRFHAHCKPKSGTFYLRQVISSANFSCGTDLIDFMHGFLNYQVEHHLWPDLSMKSYQKAQPLIEALCKKHGVPYVKENVFKRLWLLVKIMVGTDSMRKYPDAYEYAPDIVADEAH